MRSIVWHRLVGVACLVAVGMAALAAPAAGAPVVPRRPRAMNLFASAGLLLEVNRIQCGLTSSGEVCVAFAGSPVGGGGFWPKGTPDQYIFNSGLQIAGRVSPTAGFAWAGDTTGAFFFDAQGDQDMGEPLQPVYNALNTADAAAWPNGAVVRDQDIYHPVLLGLNAISQGDAWTRYWEGNPIFLNGRTHPMGIVVDQRALAWNYPSGNEDIMYFVFTFYNVSASDRAVYTNATIPAPIQDEIHAAGVEFQRLNETRFNIAIPNGGYTLTDVYAAFAMDADVADATRNFATAFLPFDIGTIYAGDWLGSEGWVFPPDIFGPPFAAAPGFIGVKYLKAPSPLGLTMFSQTYNPNDAIGLLDATGVNQLYRYLSGFMGPSDSPCSPFANYAIARVRRLCYLGQSLGDARFYQASGPFDLAPGEARTIVVAYIQAAPTAAVAPFIGISTPPGVPFTGDSIFADPGKIRPLERIAGWVSENDANSDQIIQQGEVVTTPRSLFNKALVAQAVYDNKFLLPFAPAAPQFYLVPGDNQVTVVWQKSPTEIDGDPFHAIASQPTVIDPGTGGPVPNALYDPNFRKFDVEGYRIYRGRTASALQLVAQFDYAETTFKDYTGAIAYGDADGDGAFECAPELGLQQDCPITFATAPPYTDSAEVNLFSQVIQIPPGGRVELASGGTINLRADTAVTGGASGFPPLRDNGVAFAYVDRDVRNSFTYSYVVTAFDVNSIKSTPTSLESPRVSKRVTPRLVATNLVPAEPVGIALLGTTDADTVTGSPLTINANGTFTGPPPPTTSFAGIAGLFADQLVTPGYTFRVKIDSIVPDYAGALSGATYYLTKTAIGPSGTTTTTQVFTSAGPLDEGDGTPSANFEQAVPADAAGAAQVGLAGLPSAGLYTGTLTLHATTFNSKDIDWHTHVDGSFFDPSEPPLNNDGGSRWFDGANETMADPTLGDASYGQLTGVTTIMRPARPADGSNVPVNALFRRWDQTTRLMGRQADIKIYWGTTPGTVDSVVDRTHKVAVPFDPQNRASYGFLGDVAGASATVPGAPDGVVSYTDFSVGACLPGVANLGQTGCLTRPYLPAAQLSPVDVTGDLASDGQGFGLYIAGEPYIFLLAAATLPAKPAVWTLRSYYGLVTKTGTGYSYTPKPDNPAVTGLRLSFTTGEPATFPATAQSDLSVVHTVPDPYYVTNALETTANTKVLKFVNLPSRAIIRIYSVSGVLVNVVVHDDPTGGAEATWNLRNRNNQFVASGVYFYHVETPAGGTKVGRFTVINFAP